MTESLLAAIDRELLPKAIYDELIATGRAHPHHIGVRGFVSYRIARPDDVAQALALFRMNYDRATANAPGQAAQ